MHIHPRDLLSPEDYARNRDAIRSAVIPYRRTRTVHLGDHVTLLFENERTIRYQIHEMLRIEKIFDEAGIRQEIEVYDPLVPDGSNWKATMLIEFEDEEERKRELGRLLHIEDRVWVRVAGREKIYAIADEDMERETADKTSAVHFLRFELTPQDISALHRGGGIEMGVDHELYEVRCEVEAKTVEALAGDVAGSNV